MGLDTALLRWKSLSQIARRTSSLSYQPPSPLMSTPMAMAGTTNNSANSCNLTDQQMIIVEAVGGGAAGISILTSVFVIVVAIIFRKYRFSTQRIILYLNFTVLLYSIVLVLHVFDYDGRHTGYCVFTGFLDQQISWYVLMAICCLTFDLLRKAVFLQLHTGKYEFIYLFVIFVVPFTFNWIPFVDNTYGLARATCWIKEVNLTDCTTIPLGIAFRFALYWVPFYLLMVSILIAYVVVRIVVHRRKRAYKGQYNPSEQHFMEVLEKEIGQYQWYPLLFIAWNIFPILARVVQAGFPKSSFFGLRVAQAIVNGLQGTLISLVYTLDYDMRRQLSKPRNFAAAFLSFFTKGRKVEEYDVIPDPGLTDSLSRSGGSVFDTDKSPVNTN